MSTVTYNDSIDTRLAFKVYAVIAWIAGGLLDGWGGLLFRLPLAGLPYGDWMAVRVAGAALLCSGFLAIAMARTLDDEGRRRALGWWALGHAVAALGLGVQVTAVIGLERPGWGGLVAMGWLLGVAGIFGHLWQTADGLPWGGLGVVRSHPSVLRDLRQPSERRVMCDAMPAS